MERMSAAHMAVDGEYNELPLSEIKEDWEGFRPGPVLFGSNIVSLAFIQGWSEWWIGSAGPILGFLPGEPLQSIGWTSGALVDPNISKAANVMLSFLAFSAQAFVTTCFCYTVAVAS